MWLELYIVFIWFTLIVFFLLKVSSKKAVSRSEDTNISDHLTIIIPFRNEKKRITQLLRSLNKLESLPHQILFVNDHSNDRTVEIINEWMGRIPHSSILDLTESYGKKSAIELGVNNATTPYVLTLDADVWFNPRFLSSINFYEGVSLYVRPVVFISESIVSKVFDLEHIFFNSLNNLLFSVYPLSASGANLLFEKKAYQKYNELSQHVAIASGDDYFLLRNFQRNNLKLFIENKASAAVYTNSPTSLKEYLEQRIRWIGKTVLRSSLTERLMGIFAIVYVLGGFSLLLYLSIIQDFKSLLFLLIARTLLDLIIFLSYAISLRITSRCVLIPFFQLCYPFIMITTMVASLFLRPQWKGRTIK